MDIRQFMKGREFMIVEV